MAELSLREMRNALKKFTRQQTKWRAWFEAVRRNLTPVEKILAAAESVYPQVYVITLPLPALAVNTVPDTQRITQGTRFILDRIIASWMVTGAGGVVTNRWWPLASSEPTIASAIANAGIGMVDQLDFTWELIDAGKGRSMSNAPIPGDQLFRLDRDGMMGRYPPVFDGGNEIQFKVTATAPPPNAGTFYVCLWGLEARMEPEGITGI